MKKVQTLLALTTLAAAMGAAQAQSVTVFGVVDAALTSASGSGSSDLLQMNTDGNTSSRWGLRGVEDLGGGLRASFHLEGSMNVDNGGFGTASTNNVAGASSALFGRRSTVSLTGGFGEVRLGRDLNPSFRNLSDYHPFGTNGVAQAGALFYPVANNGITPRTNVRTSNSITYLGTFGPVQASVMYGMGETAGKDDGNYMGGRLVYTMGPLSLAGATATTKYTGTAAAGGNDYIQSNLAASYQAGPAKLMYLYGKNEVGNTSTTANMVGVQYAIGKGEIRAQYTTLTEDGFADTSPVQNANQWGVGYVHNMSKRTALYGTYSTITNEGVGRQFSVSDGGVNVTTPGGSSNGVQVGIRHSF